MRRSRSNCSTTGRPDWALCLVLFVLPMAAVVAATLMGWFE